MRRVISDALQLKGLATVLLAATNRLAWAQHTATGAIGALKVREGWKGVAEQTDLRIVWETGIWNERGTCPSNVATLGFHESGSFLPTACREH